MTDSRNRLQHVHCITITGLNPTKFFLCKMMIFSVFLLLGLSIYNLSKYFLYIKMAKLISRNRKTKKNEVWFLRFPIACTLKWSNLIAKKTGESLCFNEEKSLVGLTPILQGMVLVCDNYRVIFYMCHA